jgi:predicted nucleotidyltransferase
MKNLNTLSLPQNDNSAINEALSELNQKYAVNSVYLFGSKARGDYDEYSDIDLLLVLEKTPSSQSEKQIVELLFDIGMKYNVLFSSLRTSVKEWNGMFKTFPIYKEIIDEGVRML